MKKRTKPTNPELQSGNIRDEEAGTNPRLQPGVSLPGNARDGDDQH